MLPVAKGYGIKSIIAVFRPCCRPFNPKFADINSVLFISTLNFATNPRLVKEVRLALQQGHHVEVVCFEFDNWSFPFNQQIKNEFKENGVILHIIPGGRKPFLPWAVSVFLELFFRVIGRVIPIKGWMLSQAVTRRTMLLLRKVNCINGNFDLVIGHNPGALYPTWAASQKFSCKCGFDVEDYHPGEGDNMNVQKLTRELMNTFLPKMEYVSFAAPLMKTKTIDDIGFDNINWIEVYNFFSKEEFVAAANISKDKLRIVWFSQNVNFKRGLEQIIPVLEKYTESIELTLIGNRKEEFFNSFLSKYPFVKYMPPMDQQSLHKQLSAFDIGLAIEPGKDYNNIIAWSNKLLTYFQCGLFVLASDTPAHKDFFEKFPQHGVALPLQNENAAGAIEKLLDMKESIQSGREDRYSAASSQCWEEEAKKLLEVWKSLRVRTEHRINQKPMKIGRVD